MPFKNVIGTVHNQQVPVTHAGKNAYTMSAPLDFGKNAAATMPMQRTAGNVSMIASATPGAEVFKAQRPRGFEAISKNNFGRRTNAIQMIGAKKTSLNLSKNFVNGHIRSNPVFMKIPQHEKRTNTKGIKMSESADFKIEGEKNQEMHEEHDHWGESLQLSAFQLSVWSGFMAWIAFASPASAKTYPFMEQVNNFDPAALASAEQPTGFIVPKTPLPVYKEFIFDDAKQEFGKYAFRFANGSFTDKTAMKADLFPHIQQGEMGFAGNMFSIALISGIFILAYPTVEKFVQMFQKKYTEEMPAGQTHDWVMGPKKFPFVKYNDNPLGMNAFREKETKRVLDHIAKVRAFHDAQEERYEAQRAAKRERVRMQQANGFNLPWHELVLKERAEKGPAWMIVNNSFWESLKFNQQMYVPFPANGVSFNPGYTVPKKSFVDTNEEKPGPVTEAAEAKKE